MPTRRTLLIGGAAAATTAFAAAAYTLIPRTLPPAQVYSEDGIALRGTDTVAYFTDGTATPGSAEFAHDWAGATWHFASAENRDAFAADPTAYAPQYGGFCAWAVAAKSELFSTQPENWAIVDGKLYLNFNDSVQEQWDVDRDGFIRQGDEAWPEIVADA